jgi:hypothetical protein
MAISKLIKGQAWITPEGKLLQEQTLITSAGTSSNVVSLIDNIWDDLTKEGTYKYNEKKTYFYWEYKMTSIEDDNTEVTVMIECPKPKEGLFEEPYDPSKVKGEYAKYWVGKLKTTAENYAARCTIQPREVVFPGTEYVNSLGEIVKVEKTSVSRDDLGDITNLLASF